MARIHNRVCTRCSTSFQHTNFYRTECDQCFVPKSRSPKASRTCKGCGVKFQPRNNKHQCCDVCTPDKSAMHRFRRYGVIQPQVDAIYHAQGGVCPPCGEPLTEDMCIDHCHKTGRVRGLLCRGCNMVAARFEDERFANRMTRYLGLCD